MGDHSNDAGNPLGALAASGWFDQVDAAHVLSSTEVERIEGAL